VACVVCVARWRQRVRVDIVRWIYGFWEFGFRICANGWSHGGENRERRRGRVHGSASSLGVSRRGAWSRIPSPPPRKGFPKPRLAWYAWPLRRETFLKSEFKRGGWRQRSRGISWGTIAGERAAHRIASRDSDTRGVAQEDGRATDGGCEHRVSL